MRGRMGGIVILIQLYGPPEIVQSGDDGEFKGAVERLLRAWGIKIKSTVYIYVFFNVE